MQKRITYVISDIDRAIAFEWIFEQIDKTKFELSFVLLKDGTSYFEEYLIKSHINFVRINYKSKKDLPSALLKLISFFKKNQTEIVHTHLFNATFLGMIAAKLCGIKKRIYTRHYSTYHHQYFPNSVKWDKLNNKLATHIIAISKVVKDVLIAKEDVKEEKINLIYHGFKLEEFSEKNLKIIESLKMNYNPLSKQPIIGTISRFTELKGLQYIIPAFMEVLKEYPNALLLLFNASGDYTNEIDKLLQKIPSESYRKIVFEKEITSLYHLFDVFIHTPINDNIEAFGQTYIESMASGVPLIATKSGIANEILVNNINAIVVPYKNSQEICSGVKLLLDDLNLRMTIIKNAQILAIEKFQLNLMIGELEKLYLS